MLFENRSGRERSFAFHEMDIKEQYELRTHGAAGDITAELVALNAITFGIYEGAWPSPMRSSSAGNWLDREEIWR